MSKDDDIRLEDKKVLESLNEAIKKGPWDKTLFLRAIGQKLQELRDRYSQDMAFEQSEKAEAKDLSPAHLAARMSERSGQVEIFVSLYSADGGNLHNWERQLHTLGKQIISRPVFQSEDDVRELIRSKINKRNEAYACVYIKKSDIMQPAGGKAPLDALGHTLLVVREGAASPNNITRFIHSSGQYKLKDGKLERTGDLDYSDFK